MTTSHIADPVLTVRELQPSDIPLIISYWMDASPEHLQSMGVDPAKMLTLQQWQDSLLAQLAAPLAEKASYCLIWEVDGQAVGHCNINTITLGSHAHMHLHLWQQTYRAAGLGVRLVRLSVPVFFDRYQLQQLYCEPYALNEAPNKTLMKAGFTFVEQRVGIPGSFSFVQPANLWVLGKSDL